ncbi:hypothetical protein VP01_1100g2 [Puccinia sorghi]|uniref:Uncharacterized protein n=1 Tax=Puccinia sorghi TaxID=27349 RepID=A0A0L6VUA0_9BASI|nr:hypothetical protein VP01_1100g2 [Puccinia sorghi]
MIFIFYFESMKLAFPSSKILKLIILDSWNGLSNFFLLLFRKCFLHSFSLDHNLKTFSLVYLVLASHKQQVRLLLAHSPLTQIYLIVSRLNSKDSNFVKTKFFWLLFLFLHPFWIRNFSLMNISLDLDQIDEKETEKYEKELKQEKKLERQLEILNTFKLKTTYEEGYEGVRNHFMCLLSSQLDFMLSEYCILFKYELYDICRAFESTAANISFLDLTISIEHYGCFYPEKKVWNGTPPTKQVGRIIYILLEAQTKLKAHKFIHSHTTVQPSGFIRDKLDEAENFIQYAMVKLSLNYQISFNPSYFVKTLGQHHLVDLIYIWSIIVYSLVCRIQSQLTVQIKDFSHHVLPNQTLIFKPIGSHCLTSHQHNWPLVPQNISSSSQRGYSNYYFPLFIHDKSHPILDKVVSRNPSNPLITLQHVSIFNKVLERIYIKQKIIKVTCFFTSILLIIIKNNYTLKDFHFDQFLTGGCTSHRRALKDHKIIPLLIGP